MWCAQGTLTSRCCGPVTVVQSPPIRFRTHAPRQFKLTDGPLLVEVSAQLRQLWSPQGIAGRLRLDFPDDPGIGVSHETTYLSLFVQGRGELRRELARCLRSGRTTRRSRTTCDPTRSPWTWSDLAGRGWVVGQGC